MSIATVTRFQAEADRPLFAELSVVEITRVVETDDGAIVPAGSRGTIVAIYGGGAAYEVEFARPVIGNCTLDREALRPV
ncbi:DUF4926 domain-containing protein [uncultured Methylobacterium sp.]|uniref:DUF4926 domain-containing protein n=1 Tax=uncultured Methylobacterium sp. TaxID=157278 RepID=UPI00258D1AF3|nr:DUF4926 domain-containing protein [uncultured Methylobacterium sp.]